MPFWYWYDAAVDVCMSMLVFTVGHMYFGGFVCGESSPLPSPGFAHIVFTPHMSHG